MAEETEHTNGRTTARDVKKGAGRGGRAGGARARSRSPLGAASGTRASRRVYVANVPFDVKWNELKDLFRDKIGNVTYCQLFEDEQGRSRGCGLVEFNDPASAQKAIEVLHRYEFRNREMVVKEDLDCERDRYGRLLLPGKTANDGREDNRRGPAMGQGAGFEIQHSGYGDHSTGSWNTYGLSTQFLESLGIRGPLNHRIFVANLDYKVGEKKLEEIFRLAGKVLRVRLYTDSQGVSKGHGTVEFDHPVEAVQAISMFHDQKLYGRPMSIRMDKYEAEDVPEELPAKLPSGLDGIGKGLGIGGQPLNVSKSLLGSSSSVAGVTPQPPPAPVVPTNSLSNIPNVASLAPLINSITSGVAPALDRSFPNIQPAQSNVTPSLNPYANLNVNSVGGNRQVSMGVPMNNVNLNSMNNSTPFTGYERDYRTATDTVLVRNLPPTVSWQSLRDRFNEVAEVRYAELKGVGIAVVRFMNERDAQRAIEVMNRAQFEGRIIDVVPYYNS